MRWSRRSTRSATVSTSSGCARPPSPQEGDDEILVQLPGIQDPERAKELIGKTGVLQFKLVDDKHSFSDAVARRRAAG